MRFKILSKRTFIITTTLSVVIAISSISVFALLINRTIAAPVVGFKAGKIIDDGIFTNHQAMNPSQIQNFLNAKVPNCDTWGTQPSEFGGGTRAQWGAAHGNPAPFICLKDYSEGGRSSAQIIYDIAQQYKINPQVLIVLLQKEQGLVTDTWPLTKQYRTATGYGCPDTAPCDAQYYGLTNQLSWSAKMFRAIMNNSPSWYTPYVLGNNFIRWSPNSACGGSTVNIENRATQALYNYTPYQPNQAALNAGYGTGDACSAYGNRNFYLYFSDWFGSTTKAPLGNCPQATVDCVWSFRDDLTGEFFYTTDINERNTVHAGNYTYMGVHFFVRKQNVAGTIPVYRLYSTSGRHLWTAEAQERNQLLASGLWQDEGVAFYVDPTKANTGDPVHRLYTQSSGGVHILTRDETYMAHLRQNGYTDEGTVFTSISPAAQDVPPPSTHQNVYRLQLKNEHFWTTSARERDTLIYAGARYEGTSWQTLSAGTQPVYRLYSPSGTHFWTTSTNERTTLLNAGWKNEGIAYQTNTNGSPVYRVYNTKTGNHLWTISSAERNGLLTNPDWRNEDISWYY